MATIDRSGAEALIPEAVAREIIQNVPERSAVMQLGRRLPNMSSSMLRMPILAALVESYFVEGEVTNDDNAGGWKNTTMARWENRYIHAAEIATIVPIPENVIADAGYDLWAEVQPRIEESIGGTFDRAVFYGTNAPANWPDGIVTGAAAAGNVVARGDVTIDGRSDIYNDIFAEDGVIAQVEDDGYEVTGHVGALRLRSLLRGLRDDNGQPIFTRSMQDVNRYLLDGSDIFFPRNGSVDRDQSLLISGDFDQLVWSVRQDISYKMLDQAVIQNPATGEILYNLPQQNMVALRVTFRAGWQLPNPMNHINPDDETRYPFAVLTPAGEAGGGGGGGD